MKKLKTLSLVCAMVFIVTTLFLAGCKKEEVKQTANVPTTHWNMIAGDDPQIVKELEYMRDQKIISPETYSKWIKLPKNSFMMSGSSYIDKKGKTQQEELYGIYPYDPIPAGMMTDPDFISRRSIQEEMNTTNGNLTLKGMKRAQNMFGSSGGLITLRFFTANGTVGGQPVTAVSPEWRTAISQAITEWNNLGLKVQFTTVDATNTNIVGGYVNVYMGVMPNSGSFAGVTPSPTPGYFGDKMIINTASIPTPNSVGKKRVMIHELGHVLGFKHNDSPLNNMGTYETNVYNTAVNCSDVHFMNSTSSANAAFVSFTTCEKSNFNYYWGY